MARLIDADAFGRWINDERLEISGNRSETETYDTLGMVMDMMDEMPTIDAVPVVHGKWIDMQEDDSTEGMWRCSACGSERYFDIMTPTECGCFYCPNCGATMTEG